MTADTHTVRPQPGRILDLFTGAGGWEEGLRVLGLRALGVETDRWACGQREPRATSGFRRT